MEIPCTSMTSANQLSIISVVRSKNLMGTMWREAQDTSSELQVETDVDWIFHHSWPGMTSELP